MSGNRNRNFKHQYQTHLFTVYRYKNASEKILIYNSMTNRVKVQYHLSNLIVPHRPLNIIAYTCRRHFSKF